MLPPLLVVFPSSEAVDTFTFLLVIVAEYPFRSCSSKSHLPYRLLHPSFYILIRGFTMNNDDNNKTSSIKYLLNIYLSYGPYI